MTILQYKNKSIFYFSPNKKAILGSAKVDVQYEIMVSRGGKIDKSYVESNCNYKDSKEYK
jgi:hypothetical protein